ncbi:MAG: hypothetical protein OHK93_008069 [Ramalina farinacea]|uniref:GPR1/FUN34/YaaH-class plasma membrane protein n=1 Tax=Ramalina farinacea TaxID=258253 RepID=A0AA43TUR1_9LECA|nr:hypothetical protein [Ramalina farinacea]
MDTYLNFHRQRDVDRPGQQPPPRTPALPEPEQVRTPQWKLDDDQHPNSRWNNGDTEKGFNPTFPSMQDLSEESGRTHNKYLNHSPVSPYQAGRDHSSDEALHKLRTANSVTISPELFEKIYLNPQNNVKGDLRQTFGNPTPLALLGFLLSLSPLSCELMGWRGAGGNGVATIAAYYFIGGFLMSLGGILEFFLGNTFSFVVFCSFGGFWFTLGGTLTPAFNAYGAYVTDNPGNDPNLGITSPEFHASFGFFLLFMGLMSFIYLICALRTNLVFVAIFFGLLMTFVVLTGSYWHLAMGNAVMAQKLQVAAGAFGFMAVMAGWWIFFAQMLASVDFPIEIPVGDISHFIKPLSEVKSAKSKYPSHTN